MNATLRRQIRNMAHATGLLRTICCMASLDSPASLAEVFLTVLLDSRGRKVCIRSASKIHKEFMKKGHRGCGKTRCTRRLATGAESA
jgi:hypothetical protein